MKILYLCDKKQYDTKMSRVRFHSMDAIGKVSDLIYSGRGWSNYNNDLSVQENIDNIYGNGEPDIVIAYKPLELKNFADIKPPKCMRYNEMWDKRWTAKEIMESGSELIICHHLNDIPYYRQVLPNVKIVNIPHCAEQSIYRDYGEKKDIDVLLTGAISKHYPFRARLRNIMLSKLSSIVNCKVLGHPGGDLNNIKGPILEDYARLINRSKITLTCSSRHKYRLGKYVEIPMSGSLLAADLPDESHDDFREFMLVLDPKESDETIIDKIVTYVRDDNVRNKKIKRGLEWAKNYTQEKYAERVIAEIKDFLNVY